MRKLERKWLYAVNALAATALCSGILWRILEDSVAGWICGVVFFVSTAAAVWAMWTRLRCPNCGQSCVPPFTTKRETRHCPRCGTEFAFTDEP